MRSRVQLNLVATSPDGVAREVAITTSGEDTIGAIADALAAHLDRTDPGMTLRVARLQRDLARNETVDAAGILIGDEVALVPLVPPAAANDVAPVELTVSAGAATGMRWQLGEGAHVIGRSKKSDVLIDDDSVSRSHACILVAADAVTIVDLGSANGTFIDSQRLAGEQRLVAGDTILVGRTTLTLTGGDDPAPPVVAIDGRIMFNRPPRVVPPQPILAFSLDVPAVVGDRTRLPLSSSVVPLVLAGGMFALNPHQPALLLMALLSPMMAGFSLVENRVRGGRARKRNRAAFAKTLDGQERSWVAGLDAEIARRRDLAPGFAELLRRAQTRDARLWERRRGNADFLMLRVGTGASPAPLAVTVGKGDEQLAAAARELAAEHATLEDVPITVNLADAGSVALGGDTAQVAATAVSFIAQVAALHSPRDVVVAAAVPDAADEWRWLGWLPHAYGDSASLRRTLVVAGATDAKDLVHDVLRVIDERAGRTQRAEPGDAQQSIVLLLHEECSVPRALLAQLLERGPAVHVHTLFLGSNVAALPGESGVYMDLRSDRSGLITDPRTSAHTTCAHVEGVQPAAARDLALRLAPVRDASAAGATTLAPQSVALLEHLHLRTDTEERIARAWTATGHARLDASIGVAATGPFSISLREDGPHALVGGTTRSGKSELLQGLIAALAAQHPPSRFTFLVVGYKGSADYRECMKLPHAVGLVTDLDGHLVQRALRSLRAELRWRERVIDEAGVKNLTQMEAERDSAPPSLLIVVDEFAELAKDVPEFVDGVISIAAKGAGLGIHLILATQRPAGVINDRIRANTNLRIALRFIDFPDSRDVIDSPAAAQPGLPPGRAFAKVGPGALTEFQSAFGGARSSGGGSNGPAVSDLGFGGVATAAVRARDASGPTDLEVLVRASADAAARLQLPRPRRPWLPELPELLTVAPLTSGVSLAEGEAIVGLADLPDQQQQRARTWSPSRDGNMLVYGAPATGKTSVLRTIAAGLASGAPPDRLHLYALDYAPPGLTELASLPHCGDVIRGADIERTTRLIDSLRAALESRRTLLADSGASNIEAYVARGGTMPRIVLLLDGYSSFATMLTEQQLAPYADALATLAAEGRSVGVHVVISVDRRASVPSKLAAACEQRIILRLSTEDDYGMLGLPRDVYRGVHLPAGRCFVDKGVDVQCAVLTGADAAQQNAGLRAVGDAARTQYGAGDAAPIRVLPAVVHAAELPSPSHPATAIIGVRNSDLEPVTVALADGTFVVIGAPQAGRSTALLTIATSLLRGASLPQLHLLSPRRQSPLAAAGGWTTTSVGLDACAAQAAALSESLSADESAGDTGLSRVVIIDDGDELLDAPAAAALEGLVRRGADRGLFVVVALESHAARAAFAPWVKAALRSRYGLLLRPDPMTDSGILGSVKLPRPREGERQPLGRGYLVRRGAADALQVALP